MAMNLQDKIKGQALIIGVGNTLRGDDGLGPFLIHYLKGRVKADLLDTGEIPESYLGRIIDSHPDTIIVVDAVDMQAPPGTVAVIEIDELDQVSWSTHRLSLALFMKYVQENTGSILFLVGVQPGTTELGSKMTQPVEETLQVLVRYFIDMLEEKMEHPSN